MKYKYKDDACLVILNKCLPLSSEKAMAPTPVLLPGNSHGRRSLVGCSPWGPKESNTTERLHFDFSLSCIGEGNGNPPQCSCLENPRESRAWWAAVYGVAQSWTRLKRHSSSSRHCFRPLENSDEQISQTSLPWVYILAGTRGGEKEQKINIAKVIAKQIT